MIRQQDIKRNGKVDLWDVKVEGGPAQVEMWPVDAKHALKADPERYCLKLPKGTKPGPAHDAALERLAEEAGEENAARDSDPVYGRGRGAA